MHTRSFTWREPHITAEFGGLLPGRIVQLPPRAGFSQEWSHIRITQAPIPRRMREADVNRGPLVLRGQWVSGWVVFGEMVFDHARPDQPVDWRTSPSAVADSAALPVAMAYYFANDGGTSFAAVWVGEAGQNVISFCREVLAAVPKPHSGPERSEVRQGQLITVTVVSDPGPARRELVESITTDAAAGRIIVLTADSGIDAVLAHSEADVIIVADRIRWTTTNPALEPAEQVIGVVFLEQRCIGWPVSFLPEFGGNSNVEQLELTSGVLTGAGCVSVYHGPNAQNIIGLILDAVGVSTATPQE